MPPNLAHNADGSTVFASYMQDAWHRSGTVFDIPLTASEARERVLQYDVEKLPLFYPNGDESGLYGLRRTDTLKTYGTVSNSYRLVTPADFCAAWDIAGANWPIETMGSLGDGDTMFILSQLGKRDINGDEHLQYILGVNYMNGKSANVLRVTHVRVVCWNTLMAALKDTESNFKVDHDTAVIDTMVSWISDVLETAEMKAETLAQAFELMATRELTPIQEVEAIKVAINIPNRPRKTGSPMYDAKQLETWDDRVAVAESRQDVIKALYEGEQIAYSDNALLHGTAWGMYNAITEAMDWRIPSRNDDDLARTAVDGWRAAAKEKSFKYLHNICTN